MHSHDTNFSLLSVFQFNSSLLYENLLKWQYDLQGCILSDICFITVHDCCCAQQGQEQWGSKPRHPRVISFLLCISQSLQCQVWFCWTQPCLYHKSINQKDRCSVQMRVSYTYHSLYSPQWHWHSICLIENRALETSLSYGAKLMEFNTFHSSFPQRKGYYFVNSFPWFSSFYLTCSLYWETT